MSEELKPCPFCSAIPQVSETRLTAETHWWSVSCVKYPCEIEEPTATSREDAIRFWNTRAPDLTERTAIVAWLRELAKVYAMCSPDGLADKIEAEVYHDQR